MNSIIMSFLIFCVGVITMISAGVDGYWESMNFFGWVGMILCLVGIGYTFILWGVKYLIKKIKK